MTNEGKDRWRLSEIEKLEVDEVLALLRRTNNPDLIDACLRRLGELGDPRGIEPLVKALRKGLYRRGYNPYTPVVALSKIRDKRVIKPLIEALNYGNWVLRCRAAEGLSDLTELFENDNRIINALMKRFLSEENTDVKRILEQIFYRLGGEPAVQKARTLRRLRDGTVTTDRVEQLIEKLKDVDWDIQETAVKALSKKKPYGGGG